jgi:hypothetical protein
MEMLPWKKSRRTGEWELFVQDPAPLWGITDDWYMSRALDAEYIYKDDGVFRINFAFYGPQGTIFSGKWEDFIQGVLLGTICVSVLEVLPFGLPQPWKGIYEDLKED